MVRPRRRRRSRRPPLSYQLILRWADAHHARTGRWPTTASGAVVGAPGEFWPNLNGTLHLGGRGLPGGTTLAQFLGRQRGARNRRSPPPLIEKKILAWADAHFRRTRKWPRILSGPIHGVPGETWSGVQTALYRGRRGLPGGTSLPLFLARRRGAYRTPRLTVRLILKWADAHHARTGRWPNPATGRIYDSPKETWMAIQNALSRGRRGLAEHCTLPQLLAKERNVKHLRMAPRLTEKKILAWADAHHRRTGRWPSRNSGPIAEAPEDSWKKIDAALTLGTRGLPGGRSLPRLLNRYRGKRNIHDLLPLTYKGILRWADLHRRRTGEWPSTISGPVVDAKGETWKNINITLWKGGRGLPGGLSLRNLLIKSRRLREAPRRPRRSRRAR